MASLRSFPAVAGPGARILILGSMPGAASLKAGRYYAHPRNVFWRIILDIFRAQGDLPYRARLKLLKDNGIALWDVLRSCERPGSSDSAILLASIETNGFAEFFPRHPEITEILFNGAKAEECFRKYALPLLPPACAGLRLRRLPSTSPAHASLAYPAKLKAWRKALLRR